MIAVLQDGPFDGEMIEISRTGTGYKRKRELWDSSTNRVLCIVEECYEFDGDYMDHPLKRRGRSRVFKYVGQSKSEDMTL